MKHILDRHRHEGESYNDILERVLDEDGDFSDRFGRWSDKKAQRVREQREQAKTKRKARLRRLGSGEGESTDA